MVLVLDDEPDGPVMPIITALSTGDPIVPALWEFEVASALVMARRRGRLDDRQLARSLSSLAAMGCRHDAHPVDMALLAKVSIDHDITAYDGAYLSLAMRRGVPLATVDSALARAAGDAGVALVC